MLHTTRAKECELSLRKSEQNDKIYISVLGPYLSVSRNLTHASTLGRAVLREKERARTGSVVARIVVTRVYQYSFELRQIEVI